MKDNKYFDSLMYPRPLKAEVQLDLINKYYESKDNDARKTLIEHNIRLVIYIINKRFCNSNLDVEELFEVGVIGLIKGIDSFNPHKGFLFATYVSKCITNEILMAFRRENKVGITVSLDDCINPDDSGNELLLKDIIKDDESLPEDNYINKETYDEIKDIINSLPKKDRQIIIMYFGFGGKRYTQKQISELLGFSQSYISRIVKRNIEKIGVKLKIKMFGYKTQNIQMHSTTSKNNTKVSMQSVNNEEVYNYLTNFILNRKFMNIKTAKLMYLKYKYKINDNKILAFLLKVDEKKINKIMIEGLNALKNAYLEVLNSSIKFDNGYVHVKK